jgi:hypothetical protein
MFNNIDNFSIENLDRIRKILKIVLDELEIQGINRLLPAKIPLAKFEKEGLFYNEVSTILNKIGHNENDIIQVINEDLKRGLIEAEAKIDKSLLWLPEYQKNNPKELFLKLNNLSSEDDLHKYLFLQVKDLNILNKLKKVEEAIAEKLNGDKTLTAEEPYFDTQNKVLQYGNMIHRFQKGRKISNVCKLFSHLWGLRQRKHISGKILKEGEAFPKYALPKNLEISAQEVNATLKSIKRILKKGFPIKLKIANGVQLVLTTKKKK